MKQKIEVSEEVATILINEVCHSREENAIKAMHACIRMMNADEGYANGICNYILGNIHGMYSLLLKLGAIDDDEFHQLWDEATEKCTPENVLEEMERMDSLKHE